MLVCGLCYSGWRGDQGSLLGGGSLSWSDFLGESPWLVLPAAPEALKRRRALQEAPLPAGVAMSSCLPGHSFRDRAEVGVESAHRFLQSQPSPNCYNS